jgi:hypothetical protein
MPTVTRATPNAIEAVIAILLVLVFGFRRNTVAVLVAGAIGFACTVGSDDKVLGGDNRARQFLQNFHSGCIGSLQL